MKPVDKIYRTTCQDWSCQVGCLNNMSSEEFLWDQDPNFQHRTSQMVSRRNSKIRLQEKKKEFLVALNQVLSQMFESYQLDTNTNIFHIYFWYFEYYFRLVWYPQHLKIIYCHGKCAVKRDIFKKEIVWIYFLPRSGILDDTRTLLQNKWKRLTVAGKMHSCHIRFHAALNI